MENETLTHWGIKGMKWGVRRYQNKDGSLTPAGKKRYGDDADETKEEYEARKQKAIKSGSATEVLKFKGDLTKAEMDSAISRIRWEQDMAGLSAKEVAAGKGKADKFFAGVDKGVGYVNSGAKAWNTVANIVNAFSNSDISLPKIDTNITNGNRDQRKKEQKEKKKADEAAQKRKEQEAQKETKQKERAEKKAKQAAESSKSESKSQDKVYSGKVTGEGTSKGSQSRKSSYGDVIDVEYTEVTISSVPATTRNTGRTYVNRVLALPESTKREDE